MNMKHTLSIALFSVVIQTAICQNTNPNYQDNNNDPYNVPTPNQSSLGTYGIIPVSPYTGKADISIPLYSSTQRGVKLDINLSYDTSGQLINLLPGWTGHNWTLHAGGAITRKINGRPDEISYKGTNAGRDIFLQYNKEDIGVMTNYEKNYYDYYTDDAFMYAYDAYINNLVFQNQHDVDMYESYSNYFSNASENINATYVTGQAYADYSADIFYFNFMDISGSFFYGNDGNWKVRSDQNIRVIFDVNDSTNYIDSYEETLYFDENTINPLLIVRNPKTIKGFTLIDDNGNKYIFGGSKDYIEYSTSLMGKAVVNSTEFWTANSWMLREIQDRFGNTLFRFNYSRGTEIVQIQNAYSWAKTLSKFNSYTPERSTNKVSNATINTPVYLDSITIVDGTKIVFNHTPVFSHNAAATIYPYFTANSIITMLENTYPRMKYQSICENCLYYDIHAQQYREFILRSDSNLCYRPVLNMNLEKLKEIRIFGPDASSTDYNVFAFVYSFTGRMHLNNLVCAYGPSYSNAYTYDFYYDRYNTLPSDYLTKQFDLWGYYNGIDYDADSATSLCSSTDSYIDRTIMSGSIPGVPNVQYGTIGMLKKITYPTGGYSIIEYEQNQGGKYLSDTRQNVITLDSDLPVGGLRIKSISHYEGEVLASKQTYSYNINGTTLSSGVLNIMPKYYYEWEDDKYYYYLHVFNSIIPLANSFSPSVGYSEVSEVELDGTQTIYTYSNYPEVNDEMFYASSFGLNSVTPFDEYSSREYMRGQLLSKTKLNAQGDSIQKMTYIYDSDENFNLQNYVATTCYYVHNLFLTVGSRYHLYYFRPGIHTVVTKTKYGNLWVIDETTYNRQHSEINLEGQSGNSQKIDIWNIESETIQRGNDQIRTEYTYPYTDTGINTQLVNQFCLPVTGVRHYLNNALTDGTKTIYKQAGNIVPAYDLAFASNPTKCDTIAKYLAYTPTYKVSELVDRNGIQHHYYWNDHNQLIASAANGSINITNANADINTIIANNQSSIFAGTPTDAKLYAYNNKGLPTKIVGTNGVSASFEYDNIGRLTKIKDTNGSTTNKYTYNYGKSISSTINELSTCSLYASITGSNLIINYKIPYSAESAEIRITRTGTSITSNSHTLPTNVTEGAFGVFLNSGTSHVQICLYVNGILRETVEKDMN